MARFDEIPLRLLGALFRKAWRLRVARKPARPPRARKISARKVPPQSSFRARPDTSELKQIWTELITKFFPDRTDLLTYSLGWSTRPQKRTLASCSLKNRRVNVARELNHPPFKEWLEPLIYHELCHAVLGRDLDVTTPTSPAPLTPHRKRKIAWHGREFRTLERRHPRMAEFDAWVKGGGWRTAVRSDRSRRIVRA
jgi:hypothetical protein